MTAASDEDEVRLSDEQVAQLGQLLQREGVRTIQLDTPKGRFAITLGDLDALPASVAENGGRWGEVVCAASVGLFLTGHPSRPGPMVRQGARVAPGDMLGLVQAGPVFVPVVLPRADPRPAMLTRVLVRPGTLVGYGTKLFEVERH